MSQEEINRMSAEERELLAKLEELRAKKATLVMAEQARVKAEELAAELAKPVAVKILSREGGSICIQASNGNRPDVLAIWRAIPNRFFRAPDFNLIPIRSLDKCVEDLGKLPNLTIEWNEKAKKDIEWFLNAPSWSVDLEVRRGGIFITAKPGPETSRNSVQALYQIPGATWDYEAEDWTFPQSEGWRIFKALEPVAGVVYSPEAHELILEQITKRARLDQVAKKVFEATDEVPDDFVGLLQTNLPPRTFQYWAAEFAKEANGQALIAADTGLGKTWIALLYLEKLRKDNPNAVFVINVNAANIPNWVREIKRLAGVNAFVCTNYHKTPIQAMKELQFFRGKNYNYFIISHDTMGSYEDVAQPGSIEKEKLYMWPMYFMQAQIDAIVVDEAHKLKNPETNRFKAMRVLITTTPRRILLTATPVLNRTSELWTQLHILDPVMFNSYQGFMDRYTIDGKVPKNVSELHELLRPVSLRIKKSDVIKDFPEVNRVEVIHELTEDAKLNYETALQGLYKRIAMFSASGTEYSTEINHILHQFNALKQICAADKVERTVELAREIMDEANGEAGEKKVLIFSHWLGVAKAIAEALGDEAICTVKKASSGDGFTTMNMNERDELFERARNDKKIKYLVTTEASGTGMNMEYVWWTIFNDPFWTPAGHKQCEGRAQRISNLHKLDSFYVRADTQIEEWNFELLMNKMEIIDATVDSVEMTRDASESILMELINKVKADMWERGVR